MHGYGAPSGGKCRYYVGIFLHVSDSKGYFRSSFLMVTAPDVAGRDIELGKGNSLMGLVRPGVSADVQSKAYLTRPTARVCLNLGAA